MAMVREYASHKAALLPVALFHLFLRGRTIFVTNFSLDLIENKQSARLNLLHGMRRKKKTTKYQELEQDK